MGAHQESLASMGLPAPQVEASLHVAPVDRRGSTGGLKEPPTPREGLKETGAVKARLRATQRKYLAAAHDQIWGMIDQFKVKGEVVPENRAEIETTIRKSLDTVVASDSV